LNFYFLNSIKFNVIFSLQYFSYVQACVTSLRFPKSMHVSVHVTLRAQPNPGTYEVPDGQQTGLDCPPWQLQWARQLPRCAYEAIVLSTHGSEKITKVYSMCGLKIMETYPYASCVSDYTLMKRSCFLSTYNWMDKLTVFILCMEEMFYKTLESLEPIA
jgi:hypothetical protein